jgi:predicted DNA-binding protein
MSKMKQKNKQNDPTEVVPLRIPDELSDRVRRVASQEGLSNADVMRMAILRGLPVLEKLLAKPDKQAA